MSMEAWKASIYGLGSTDEVLYRIIWCGRVQYGTYLYTTVRPVPLSGNGDQESPSEYYVTYVLRTY